jgi:hypothetical protein
MAEDTAITQPPTDLGLAKNIDPRGNIGAISIESERAVAEVKAAVTMARMFPRDEMLARQKVLAACSRPELARVAIYRYPRGGQQIEGPSIRLAEVLVRAWGNCHFGFKELAVYPGESEIESYCWDLESNNRIAVAFRVAHSRYKKGEAGQRGTNTAFDDPRDIYENNANNASRRLRRCILESIDGDLVHDAIQACRQTIAAGVSDKKSLEDKTKELVDQFAKKGIKIAHLNKQLGHSLDTILPDEYVDLAGIFMAIKEGANPSDYFDVPRGTTISEKADEAEAALKAKAKPEPPADQAPLIDAGDGGPDEPPPGAINRPPGWKNGVPPGPQ